MSLHLKYIDYPLLSFKANNSQCIYIFLKLFALIFSIPHIVSRFPSIELFLEKTELS